MGPDLCHRETEMAQLLEDIRRKLLQAFVPGAEGEYTAILLAGSGTAAVEAALMSSIPYGKRALIINNGVYGARMAGMVGMARLGTAEFKLDWTARPDPEKLRLALRQHPEVHAVAMVHHETTTGLINPVKEIADVVDSQNRVFVVDSVSGLGGESIDIAGSHIYMVAGSAGKCIEAFPGLSFVLVRKGFIERMKGYPKRSWYLHLPEYFDGDGRPIIPFTPAVQLCYALREALDALLAEGVANRCARYRRAAARIRQRLAELGVKALLPSEVQSNSLTAFHLPPGLSYAALHGRLKERGYVIYAGQGQLESGIFRIANMGQLSDRDINGFLEAFAQCLEPSAARA
jgi:2-aminoethylphosphonate-pyruvate transaminase